MVSCKTASIFSENRPVEVGSICINESKYAGLAEHEAQKYRSEINNTLRSPLPAWCCSRGIT